MFAVFSRETAMPPLGLIDLTIDHEDQGEQVKAHLAAHSFKRKEAKVLEFGSGNSFSYSRSHTCHHASLGHISCMFAGHLEQWPDLEYHPNGTSVLTSEEKELVAGDEVKWLLAFYRLYTQSAHQGIPSEALASLATLQGHFAFIIYDKALKRVLAARDRTGSESLNWGLTSGGSLLFSSCREELSECRPSATPFPSGSLFLSETKARAMQPGETGWMIDNQLLPGGLVSFVPRSSSQSQYPYRFVKAVPRITSKGHLCGMVYKVASENNMAEWNSAA